MKNSYLWIKNDNNRTESSVLEQFVSTDQPSNGPLLKAEVPNINIKQVSECSGNFLILDEEGKVYSLGETNQYGILGRGHEHKRDASDLK